MEGLSGFDRSMMKRLESSALAFYELKHQPQQQQKHDQEQFTDRGGCFDKTKTVERRRLASDRSSPLSSTSSTPSSQICAEPFSSEAARTLSDRARGVSGSAPTSGTLDDILVTGTTTGPGGGVDRSPASGGPGGICSGGSISFSISRILGHTSISRRPVSAAATGRSTPPDTAVGPRARCQSGVASPDSSCRVAGEDTDHDVKRPNDVNNDDDVTMKLQRESPATTVVCGETLHRLSWLQCTRYKPPKLPRKSPFYIQIIIIFY